MGCLLLLAGCARPAKPSRPAPPALLPPGVQGRSLKPPPRTFDAQGNLLIAVVDPSGIEAARRALRAEHVEARVEDAPSGRVWVRPDAMEVGLTTLLEDSRGKKYRLRTAAELAPDR